MKRSLVAAVLLALGLVVAAAPAAWAHNTLRTAEPADGATVPSPPEQLVLTFDATVLQLGAALQVTGPGGALELEAPVVEGARLVQPLPEELPAGEYRTVWRVTSGDGHPIDGELTFTSEDGGATAAASPTPSAIGGPTDDEGATPASEPASTATGEDPAGGSGDLVGLPRPAVLALGGLALVGTALAFWATARRRGDLDDATR